MPASNKYLKPDVIARLRGLQLRARDVVAGFVSGMHRSAYHGFSVEFAEHRQYAPGDDVRYVDWRIFGRADRLQIKQYEEETNLRCNILLDASGSMRYGGASAGGVSKFEYACGLAASLAYLLVSQQDAVGLITYDSEVRSRLPSSTGKRHLANFLEILEDTRAARATDVKVLFHRLAEELRQRSMVIVISDLLAEVDELVSGLEHIARAGHELIVLHVMDDDEWRLPFTENIRFEGLELDRFLLVDPQSLRDSYVSAVQRFVARVQAACLRTRGDYVSVNTADPMDAVLTGYLARRAGRVVARRRG